MLKTKIVITTSSQDAARSVAGLLGEVLEPAPDAVSVFVVPGEAEARVVEAYYSEPPDATALATALRALWKDGIEPPRAEFVPDENWVTISQAALPPVHAGRFVVHGSHDRARVGRGLNALEIDAGEAFGTAHHATTQGCLMALDQVMRARCFTRIADIGCGSGVLALAASRMAPGAWIIASDLDPVAVDVARENAQRNRAGGGIDFVVARGFEHAELRCARFDLVLANILAGPLIQLAPTLRRQLFGGGVAILSGLLTSQAAEVMAACRAQQFCLQRRIDLVGWTTLVIVQRGGPVLNSQKRRSGLRPKSAV